MKFFVIYDSKSESYQVPFFHKSIGTVERDITDVVNNDSKSPYYKWPEDYTLFEIGSWDESTGVMTLHDSKVNLGVLIEFKTVVPT